MRSFPFFSVMALTVCAVAACKKSAPQAAGGVPDFHKPADPAFAQQAPDSFRARLSTTQGDVVILVHRAWAPHGTDRFYNLVRSGFYDGVRFFRVIPGFMAQFGIHGDTGVTAAWRPRTIPDDPVRATNGRGMVTYATAGPATRTTQIFINYGDNRRPAGSGFPPVGRGGTPRHPAWARRSRKPPGRSSARAARGRRAPPSPRPGSGPSPGSAARATSAG